MFSVKQAYILQRENWNKTNALINVPKKETHHESDDLNRISSREFSCLPLFALLVTHKEKLPSRMPVNLKKTEFVPAGVHAGSSSRTFHPEVTGARGKVQFKNSYIHRWRDIDRGVSRWNTSHQVLRIASILSHSRRNSFFSKYRNFPRYTLVQHMTFTQQSPWCIE